MLTVVDPNDLDHCARGCGTRLPFFARSIAYQRGEPQPCWTCERKELPPKEALHQRILARQRPLTVVRQAPPPSEPGTA